NQVAATVSQPCICRTRILGLIVGGGYPAAITGLTQLYSVFFSTEQIETYFSLDNIKSQRQWNGNAAGNYQVIHAANSQVEHGGR
ncbi:unnamed protein product, partial [Musa acuminata subsp. burmannicoides]